VQGRLDQILGKQDSKVCKSFYDILLSMFAEPCFRLLISTPGMVDLRSFFVDPDSAIESECGSGSHDISLHLKIIIM